MKHQRLFGVRAVVFLDVCYSQLPYPRFAGTYRLDLQGLREQVQQILGLVLQNPSLFFPFYVRRHCVHMVYTENFFTFPFLKWRWWQHALPKQYNPQYFPFSSLLLLLLHFFTGYFVYKGHKSFLLFNIYHTLSIYQRLLIIQLMQGYRNIYTYIYS